MIRYSILLSLLLLGRGASAHQPDLSSTLLVEQGEGVWVLQVRAALTAFEYEIAQHYGEAAYTSAEEFQALVLDHVSQHINVHFDGESKAKLEDGVVKLGHETSVSFAVIGVPATIESLTVKNSSFSHVSRNQSALLVVRDGFRRKQFIMNANNGHEVSLKVEGKTFALMTPEHTAESYLPWLLGGGLLLLFGLWYFAFRKTTAKPLGTAAV